MWRHTKNKWLAVSIAVWGATVLAAFSDVSAATNIQSIICDQFANPTITTPPSGVQTDGTSVVIEGVGEPAMTVTIIRNGDVAGAALVAPDASYALEVPLEVGDNSLIAREVNECGTAKESAVTLVHRTIASEPEPSSQPPLQPSQPLPSGVTRPIGRPFVPLPDTSGFEKPVILHPTNGDTVYVSRLWVTGRAQPGSTVTIFIAGVNVARVVASESGTFGAMIHLAPGKNTIQARSRLGDNVATSDPVEVTFIPTAPGHEAGTASLSDWVVPTLLIAGLVSIVGVSLFALKVRFFRGDK